MKHARPQSGCVCHTYMHDVCLLVPSCAGGCQVARLLLRNKVCMRFTHLGSGTNIFWLQTKLLQVTNCCTESQDCLFRFAPSVATSRCLFTLPKPSAYYARLIALLQAGVNTYTTGLLGKDDPPCTNEHARVSQP